jgi:hypothetical protein
MPNQLLTIQMITNRALAVLKNQLAFTRGVNRQYDSSFGVKGAKIGDTLNVRKPPRYIGRTGQAISIEDSVETSIPVTLTTQAGVDMQFSSADLTLRIDDFSDRFIEPAIANVANKIDLDGILLMTNAAYNAVGTIGTPPTARTVLQAGALLDKNATPKGSGLRSMVIDPDTQVEVVDTLKTLFNDQNKVASQYRTGNMGANVLGFNFDMDQNIVSHTNGPLGGTPLVNGAAQSGSSLVTKGWTAAAALRLNKGDRFTIAGVFTVNPQSRQSTGTLQQFIVTANVSSDASGNATVPISPAIVATGQFQNVTAVPADNAVITPLGTTGATYHANLGFHRDAITLACADLELPRGVDMAARSVDPDTGLSIRMVRQYSITTDQFPTRLDILYGWAMLYPEWSTAMVW